VVEAATAVGALPLPSWLVAILFGRPPASALALILARFSGGSVLALGVICWWMADSQASGAALALVSTMLLYDVIAAILLLYAGIEGLVGIGLWPAVFVHVALAGWCIVELRRRNQAARPSGEAQARRRRLLRHGD
jgi:hypothetical protein